MRPVSAAFTAAINAAHTAVARAEVLVPNAPTVPVNATYVGGWPSSPMTILVDQAEMNDGDS